MTEQPNETDTQGEVNVIDPLRAPARDVHAEWRSDATKTPGQLVAEGVARKEAVRRVRWARRQAKRQAEMVAIIDRLNAKREAKRSARPPEPFEAPIPADTRRRVSEVEEDGKEGSR